MRAVLATLNDFGVLQQVLFIHKILQKEEKEMEEKITLINEEDLSELEDVVTPAPQGSTFCCIKN